MEIRKLTTPEERFEGERVIQRSFMHEWNEDEARERMQAATAAEPVPGDVTWGLFNDDGELATCVSTLRHRFAFGGQEIGVGEIHMLGSLPELRGTGGARALLTTALGDFRDRGDVFAILIPFSGPFYRKFGFEFVARSVRQRFAIEQLAGIPCDYRVTEVRREEDVAVLRRLHDAFALERNLAEISAPTAWEWRGNGEFGEPDFFHPERHRYTYILWDEQGEACAYLRFSFVCAPEMPFIGEAHVCDLVYRDAQAFLGCLGFIYRLRAKVTHVVVEPEDDIDLCCLLPEGDRIEQTVEGHIMARVLDVERALALMPQPQGSGAYAIGLRDACMPEHDGVYEVTFADGRATEVKRSDASPDIEMDETSFTQLLVGRAALDDALLRPDVRLHANADLLRRVFVRRTVCVR